jgi:tetratricopeptide (TPR) repeat protein
LNSEKKFRLLEELTRKYPQEKQAHNEIGLFYDAKRKYPEALAEYEKALVLDPNFGSALNQAGYVYAAIGDFEKAIRYFERYAAINPGQANPIDSIAELYFRMGDFDKAKAKYQEALEIRPDFSGSCRGLAYLSAVQENYPETRRWIEEFITRAPTASEKMEGRVWKAFYDHFLGRWNESRSEFLAIKEQAQKTGLPIFVGAVDWLTGYLFADRGEYDLARAAFQAYREWALKMSSGYEYYYATEYILHAGGIDLRQGRVDAAKARLEEAASRLPKVEAAGQEAIVRMYRLFEAEVDLAENLPEKATEAGLKIVRGNFRNMTASTLTDYAIPFLKDVLARAYWKKGDLDKAIAEYELLTTIDPKSQIRYLIHPMYHYRLGQVYEQKGLKDKAKAQYEHFLEGWKDAEAGHPEIADARKRLTSLR